MIPFWYQKSRNSRTSCSCNCIDKNVIKIESHLTDANGRSVTYHELGHAQLQTMYRGETEATCNFYLAYILNVKFGEDFDYAFANSIFHLPYLTLEQAPIHWMITENFVILQYRITL